MRRLLALALALTAAALAPPRPAAALASTLPEIFLTLPPADCGGYNVAQRRAMLEKITEAPAEQGPPSVPDTLSPWLRHPADNILVLQRPRAGAITYKLFEGRAFQLLVICRGRDRPAPGDPAGPLDLSLYRLDRVGLNRVSLSDYLPAIGILDFVTADTVADPRAVRALARLAPTYAECLSCSLSATHRLTMDIVTATTRSAAVCDELLPTFGRLPLTWNGLFFTKPHDRAAPRDAEDEPAQRNQRSAPRGQ